MLRSTTPSATPVPMPAFAPASSDPSAFGEAVLTGAELFVPIAGSVAVVGGAVDEVVVGEV